MDGKEAASLGPPYETTLALGGGRHRLMVVGPERPGATPWKCSCSKFMILGAPEAMQWFVGRASVPAASETQRDALRHHYLIRSYLAKKQRCHYGKN